MKRISLLTACCKRCGKEVTTTSRSLHGLDSLKAQVGILCQACATPEEVWDINHAIGEGIAQGRRRKDGC